MPAENIEHCEWCGCEVTESSSSTLPSRGLICRDCEDEAITCCNCGEFYHTTSIRVVDGEAYCESCSEDLIASCYGCGRMCAAGEMYSTPNGDLCEGCYNEENEGIHEYDYRPHLKFRGKGPLFLGIELEVEFNNVDPECLIDATDIPYFYLKHDGSLDDGCEIVSHPASFAWIQENFHDTWSPVLKLRKRGIKSYRTTTCGIHVHMSKKAFSKYHLYKFLRFFRENSKFIEKFSQREKTDLTQWASLAWKDSIIDLAGGDRPSSRYRAVNLYNRDTVEIRIFRGNLIEAGFRKNIEFCKALYDFTKQASSKSLTAIHFKKHVKKSRKLFPNLHVSLSKMNKAFLRVPTESGVPSSKPSNKRGRWTIDPENQEKEWFPVQRDGVSRNTVILSTNIYSTDVLGR